MKHKAIYAFISLTMLLTQCRFNNKEQSEAILFSTIRVKAGFEKDFAFKFMENQYVQLIPYSNDTSKQRVTNNIHLITLIDRTDYVSIADRLRCSAIFKEDTIRVKIGVSDGFTSEGIAMKIVGDRFTALPYESSDDIIPGKKAPIVKIEQQKLTLNKTHYVVGDSIYGHMYLRTIDSRNSKKYALGYFRALIKKE